jgi:hypothetical protein
MFKGAANGRPPQVSNARPGPPVIALCGSYFLGCGVWWVRCLVFYPREVGAFGQLQHKFIEAPLFFALWEPCAEVLRIPSRAQGVP